MHEGNFWLKAALCSLEAQISLMARYPTASFGRQNLTEIILSLSHPLHKEVRGSGIAARQADDDGIVKDLVNKAVKNGRILALGQYAQLIGTLRKNFYQYPRQSRRKDAGRVTPGPRQTLLKQKKKLPSHHQNAQQLNGFERAQRTRKCPFGWRIFLTPHSL